MDGGKSDLLDAHRIAAAALPLDTDQLRQPRTAQGARSALRVLIAARDHMAAERTATVNALIAPVRVLDLGVDARRPLTRAQIATVARWRSRNEDLGTAPPGPRPSSWPNGSSNSTSRSRPTACGWTSSSIRPGSTTREDWHRNGDRGHLLDRVVPSRSRAFGSGIRCSGRRRPHPSVLGQRCPSQAQPWWRSPSEPGAAYRCPHPDDTPRRNPSPRRETTR